MASISVPRSFIICKSSSITRNPQFQFLAQNHSPKFHFRFFSQNNSQNTRESTIGLSSKTSSPQLVNRKRESVTENVANNKLWYRFLTEHYGTVKVSVLDQNGNFTVRIEVSNLPEDIIKDGFYIDWGMYRSDSSQLSVPNGAGTVKIPLTKNSLGEHAAELEFISSQTPFYLSFLVLNSSGSEIKSRKGTRFCVPIGTESGKPLPLGVSFLDDNTKANFSLFSRNAESVVLCLFKNGENEEPDLEIDLDPYLNRSGDLWHVSLDVGGYSKYGYRCRGALDWKKGGRFHMRHVLLDPYAKNIENFIPDIGEKVSFAKCLASLSKDINSFNWGGVKNPNLPMEKLIMYRLNVSLFSKDGSFSGLIEKVPHFKQLGVNAILLEPIFTFDERKGPYFPYHFFSPMKKLGSIQSLKHMVKAMHKNGIEVLLEVSLSGTSEGDDTSPQTISFRGIDNTSYYMNGAGNVFDCNKNVVQTLILDCLKYWVVEYHIDGFSFVNSSNLLKSPNGNTLSRPAFVESIAFDPILSKTKIISDSFSPVDFSTGDLQFPHWKRWSEMNNKFSTDVRNFLQGKGLLSNFATRLCGSGDKFASRGPNFSCNYITRNFGLTLVDLVSFNNASELSWNCGEDGATDNATVLETRLRQIRNFLFILFVSMGVPVINMGDECGYSTGGSVSYGDRKTMDWSNVKTPYGKQMTEFVTYLAALRRRKADVFQRREFLKLENIVWGGSSDGVNSNEPNWLDPDSKFLSVIMKPEISDSVSESDAFPTSGAFNNCEVFICFNAGFNTEAVALPEGSEWVRLVDTSLPFPGFFVPEGASVVRVSGTSNYDVKPHSCVLFEAKESTE